MDRQQLGTTPGVLACAGLIGIRIWLVDSAFPSRLLLASTFDERFCGLAIAAELT
jgi:hypothetical protein